MTLLFNKQFVNQEETDLVPGKIHTIRQNYNHWKNWNGKEISIRTWEGKPYRSKQSEICRKLIYVQRIKLGHNETADGYKMWPVFYVPGKGRIDQKLLAENDGFESEDEFTEWFYDYPDGEIAILHFTNFKY